MNGIWLSTACVRGCGLVRVVPGRRKACGTKLARGKGSQREDEVDPATGEDQIHAWNSWGERALLFQIVVIRLNEVSIFANGRFPFDEPV
jgi:hypothetical protein